MGGERRGELGAGVRAASDSSIEITFSYQGQRCRERIKLKPTPPNLKRAERHRAAILITIENGTFDYSVTFPDSKRAAAMARQPGDAESLKAYLTRWLQRKKAELKASTWDDYRKIVANVLEPAFGALKLSQLKRASVRDWAAGQSCGNKRIGNIVSVLRAALDDALEDELIQANPLKDWSYRKKEDPKPAREIDPLSREEREAILAVMRPEVRPLFQFAFWTGLRTSELVALEWGDIDFLRGVAAISRAKTAAGKEAEGTKTKAGRREVRLLPPAMAALQEQKALSLLHPSGSVFLNPRTQQPWQDDQSIRTRYWEPALKRAGVRYRNPYQTRHTFASMMLSAGEHPMWVAQQMGHADWTMIAKVYGKWMPTADPDAGMKAVSLFGNAGIKAGIAGSETVKNSQK